MNKIEFYNKVVEIYKKTGQGVPKFIADKAGDDIFEDLEKDGLVKLVVRNYSHLPDDETICLTKGYCVEDDTKGKDMSALTFIRIYRGVDPVIEIANYKVSLNEIVRDPEWMLPYSTWLSKNKKLLEEGDAIELLDESAYNGEELSDETVEYLKTRGWYEENLTVSECIERMKSGDKDNRKKMEILTELIMLQNTPSVREKYKDSLAENIKEKEDLVNNEKYRKRIRVWLDTKNGSEKIQSLV
jgi:hypothetical protein